MMLCDVQNHENCYQILDSQKRMDRSHMCPADTNNVLNIDLNIIQFIIIY